MSIPCLQSQAVLEISINTCSYNESAKHMYTRLFSCNFPQGILNFVDSIQHHFSNPSSAVQLLVFLFMILFRTHFQIYLRSWVLYSTGNSSGIEYDCQGILFLCSNLYLEGCQTHSFDFFLRKQKTFVTQVWESIEAWDIFNRTKNLASQAKTFAILVFYSLTI